VAHMHYKGTGQTHSFRGLLADGGQDRIRIQGSVGSIAWRITKFQIFPSTPGTTSYEHVVKIYREEQDTVDAAVDFTDTELLGVAFLEGNDNNYYVDGLTVVFDNTLFTRNIYITSKDASTGESANYYIELEEVKVSAAGMAQLSVAAARRGYLPGT